MFASKCVHVQFLLLINGCFGMFACTCVHVQFCWKYLLVHVCMSSFVTDVCMFLNVY